MRATPSVLDSRHVPGGDIEQTRLHTARSWVAGADISSIGWESAPHSCSRDESRFVVTIPTAADIGTCSGAHACATTTSQATCRILYYFIEVVVCVVTCVRVAVQDMVGQADSRRRAAKGGIVAVICLSVHLRDAGICLPVFISDMHAAHLDTRSAMSAHRHAGAIANPRTRQTARPWSAPPCIEVNPDAARCLKFRDRYERILGNWRCCRSFVSQPGGTSEHWRPERC